MIRPGLIQNLDIYDGFKKNDINSRRIAYKPLYEFYHMLILDVGISYCNQPKATLQTSQISGRWECIKPQLTEICVVDEWNPIIKKLSDIRTKVEHKDDYDPLLHDLTLIRDKAPEFYKWIIQVGERYFLRSNKYTFKENFTRILRVYIDEAESLKERYGDITPFLAHQPITRFFKADILRKLTELDVDIYEQLPQMVKHLNQRCEKIELLDEITSSDIDNLIRLVHITSKLKGKEEILLDQSLCPKCGGTIETTHNNYGYDSEGVPSGVIVRVGCNKCDYEIFQESYDF